MRSISSWMASNCLKLNAGKTEVVVFGNRPNFWSPDWWPEEMGEPPLPSLEVKNMGVIVDCNLSYGDHVSRVVSTSFFLLRKLKKLKFVLTEESFRTAVTALILSRLDYCNSLFLNLHKKQLHRLQLVQNAD